MNEREFGLGRKEENALRELRSEPRPAPGLESRVLERVKREGLVANHRFRWVRWSIAAAIVIGILAAGILIGRGTVETAGGSDLDPANTYILLLYSGTDYEPAAGDEAMRRVAEYKRWAVDLRARGLQVNGTKLTPDSWDAGDRPTKLGDDSLVGYFLIEAQSIDQALDLARDCPHIDYGGKIVVRKVDDV